MVFLDASRRLIRQRGSEEACGHGARNGFLHSAGGPLNGATGVPSPLFGDLFATGHAPRVSTHALLPFQQIHVVDFIVHSVFQVWAHHSEADNV